MYNDAIGMGRAGCHRGSTEGVLLVVHVYREEKENGEEIIRIVSAREASQRERRIYIQQTAG
jgi:uncharacterized DUF497 family protein